LATRLKISARSAAKLAIIVNGDAVLKVNARRDKVASPVTAAGDESCNAGERGVLAAIGKIATAAANKVAVVVPDTHIEIEGRGDSSARVVGAFTLEGVRGHERNVLADHGRKSGARDQ